MEWQNVFEEKGHGWSKANLVNPEKKGWRPCDGWWPSLSSHSPASPYPLSIIMGMVSRCIETAIFSLWSVWWPASVNLKMMSDIFRLFFRVSMKPFWHFQSWDAICQFSSQTITFSSLCGPLLFPSLHFPWSISPVKVFLSPVTYFHVSYLIS